jgi:gamma-glutamylputrescine oxidase
MRRHGIDFSGRKEQGSSAPSAKTFRQPAAVRFGYAWSGNFALTITHIPHMASVGYVCFSHADSGHGVTTTRLLGNILGEAVAGRAAFRCLAIAANLPCPGGHAIRVPLTALGACWYNMRDRLGV